MSISDADARALTVLLSEERLRTLTNLTGSREAAIALHQETLHLGTALMTIIATIEIALRNAACDKLSQHFGVQDWLVRPPAPFQWRKPELLKVATAWDNARRDEYSKLSQAEKHALDTKAYPNGRPPNKSHLDRAKDRRKQIFVSDGKIIAALTLYFWKRLYGPEYDQTLWRTSLKRTFPDKKVQRPDVAANLEYIYLARNRLAHHEPVLHQRFSDVMAAIKFVVEHLEAYPPSSSTPLAKLLAQDISDVQSMADTLHATLDSYRQKP